MQQHQRKCHCYKHNNETTHMVQYKVTRTKLKQLCEREALGYYKQMDILCEIKDPWIL